MFANLKIIPKFILGYFIAFSCSGMEVEEISQKRRRDDLRDYSDIYPKRVKFSPNTPEEYCEQSWALEEVDAFWDDEDVFLGQLLRKVLPLYDKAAEERHEAAKNCLKEIFETHSKIEKNRSFNEGDGKFGDNVDDVTESFVAALKGTPWQNGNTTLTALDWSFSEGIQVTQLKEIKELLERNRALKGMQREDLPPPDEF